MKTRTLNIISLVFNCLSFIFSTIGVIWYYINAGDIPAQIRNMFFTVNSNIYLAIVCLVVAIFNVFSIIKQKNCEFAWISYLKFTAVTAISVTFFTVVLFLDPFWKADFLHSEMYTNSNFFLHILSPVTAIIGFLFFDLNNKLKWKWSWIGAIPVISYGIFYTCMVFITGDSIYDIYGFVSNHQTGVINYSMAFVVIPVMFIGAYALGCLWLLLNGFFFKKYGCACASKNDTKYSSDFIEKRENQKTCKNPISSKSFEPRIYHISRSSFIFGKWQVKLANSGKATKLFDTQKEAIDYANELIKTQGGSIRVHSLKGKIRKE